MAEYKASIRQSWADVLKGMGILLIYIGHSINDVQTSGGWLFLIVSTINLPLFYFLSGYFAMPHENLKERVHHLFLTLLVPYLIASVFAWLLVFIKTVVSSGLDRSLWDGFAAIFLQLPNTRWEGGRWFLPSFFLGKLLFESYLSKQQGKEVHLTIAGFMLAAVAWIYTLAGGIRLPWNMEAALLTQPFFVAGYLWRNAFELRVKKLGKRTQLALLGITAVGYAGLLVVIRTLFGRRIDFHERQLNEFWLAYLVCGCGLVLLVSAAKRWKQNGLLAWIGKNSLIFFLYGTYGNLITRQIATAFGIGDIWLKCLMGMVNMCLLMVPFIYVLNRYFPWTVGKKRPVIGRIEGEES